MWKAKQIVWDVTVWLGFQKLSFLALNNFDVRSTSTLVDVVGINSALDFPDRLIFSDLSPRSADVGNERFIRVLMQPRFGGAGNLSISHNTSP